jgi:hypothetical protein
MAQPGFFVPAWKLRQQNAETFGQVVDKAGADNPATSDPPRFSDTLWDAWLTVARLAV